jgi:hypothetical protein
MLRPIHDCLHGSTSHCYQTCHSNKLTNSTPPQSDRRGMQNVYLQPSSTPAIADRLLSFRPRNRTVSLYVNILSIRTHPTSFILNPTTQPHTHGVTTLQEHVCVGCITLAFQVRTVYGCLSTSFEGFMGTIAAGWHIDISSFCID